MCFGQIKKKYDDSFNFFQMALKLNVNKELLSNYIHAKLKICGG